MGGRTPNATSHFSFSSCETKKIYFLVFFGSLLLFLLVLAEWPFCLWGVLGAVEFVRRLIGHGRIDVDVIARCAYLLVRRRRHWTILIRFPPPLDRSMGDLD